MALLNKLFIGRRKDLRQNSTQNLFNGSSWKTPTFSKDQIRLLLFRECEGRSRKILFDSSSIKKVDPATTQQLQQPSNGFVQRLRRSPTPTASLKTEREKPNDCYEVSLNGVVYQCLRPQADSNMLGEMVFGSVAMSFRGTTSKIHTIRTPPQLMITKVFPSPQPKAERDRKFADSLPNSLVDCVYVRESDHLERLSSSVGSADLVSSLEIPEWRARSCHEYGQKPTKENSQLRSTNSLNSLLNSNVHDASTLSHSGSYHSLQRRWQRCRATSMEFGFPQRPEDLAEEGSLPCSRRSKLGMAVVISLGEPNSAEDRQFQTFFFSHITLIEGYVNKLRIAVEKAYLNRKYFISMTIEGFEHLQSSLYDLYTAPRLPNPVWLSMMAYHEQHHAICLKFITEFMSLLQEFDVKTSKFFVSTLLTAVLTHHLAWVPTVMPPGINPRHSYYKKHSAKWLHMLAKSHPYNPLWIQLGDLYGAVGYPCKIAKTVVIGKNAELVQRFLYVLSYFIRCSEVYENVEQLLPSPVTKKSSTSEPISLCQYSNESQDSITPDSPISLEPTKLSQEEDTNFVKAMDSGKEIINCSKTFVRSTSCDLCSRILSGTSPPDFSDPTVLVRPGRKYCDNCLEMTKAKTMAEGVRNGRIFDVAKLETNDGSSIFDRDSGISGCGLEETSLSVSPSRVLFTIGNVPLEDKQGTRCVKKVFAKRDLSNRMQCNCSLGSHKFAGKVETDLCNSPIALTSVSLTRTMGIGKHLVINEPIAKQAIQNCISNSVEIEKKCNCVEAISNVIPKVQLEHVHNVGNSCAMEAPRNGMSKKGEAVLETEELVRNLKFCICTQVNGKTCHCEKEKERTRHKSESSLSQTLVRKDSGLEEVSVDAVEVPLPKSEIKQVANSTEEYFRGFAWSLMSNFTDHYMSDFALQGTNEVDFASKLCTDLWVSVHNPVLEESIAESLTIVADTNNWTVQIVSNKTCDIESGTYASMPVSMSHLVANATETVQYLWKLKMSPEFCLMHLEDRLQEIYFKSRLLAEYLLDKPSCDIEQVTQDLGLDPSDLPLLMSVASTHSSLVTCMYGVPYR